MNNAGFATFGPFAETDLGRELEELQVNVGALTHLTKGARDPGRQEHAGAPALID